MTGAGANSTRKAETPGPSGGGDVSLYKKELKQRFSEWYNNQQGRFGTPWAERFKSLLVEDQPGAVQPVAAYRPRPELGAGRAGARARQRRGVRRCSAALDPPAWDQPKGSAHDPGAKSKTPEHRRTPKASPPTGHGRQRGAGTGRHRLSLESASRLPTLRYPPRPANSAEFRGYSAFCTSTEGTRRTGGDRCPSERSLPAGCLDSSRATTRPPPRPGASLPWGQGHQ